MATFHEQFTEHIGTQSLIEQKDDLVLAEGSALAGAVIGTSCLYLAAELLAQGKVGEAVVYALPGVVLWGLGIFAASLTWPIQEAINYQERIDAGNARIKNFGREE